MTMRDGKHSQPVPAVGDDDASHQLNFSGVAKNTPVPGSAPNDADDYIHLSNLQKNSPVSSGDDDNLDVNVTSEKSNPESYKSGGAQYNPLW